MYCKTYSNSDYENLWEAVFTSCNLFRNLAMSVGQYFGYNYNDDEDKNMMEYLSNIRDGKLA